jgi:multidrug efflux pump
MLKPRDERAARVEEIIARLRKSVARVVGANVYFQATQDIQISTRASRAQYQYTLVSTDRNEVIQWGDKLTQALRGDPAFREVASEAQEGGPRIDVRVDREQAGRLGVSMQSVTDTLYDAFGQRQVSTIYGQANQYRVVLEAQPRYQQDPASLSQIYVTGSTTSTGTTATVGNTSTGTTNTNTTATPNSVTGSNQVPLAAFASFVRTTAPLAIAHQEQFPSVTISFDLAPGYALSDAVKAISAAQTEIGMPRSVTGSYSGDASEFARSLAGEPWLILAAAITIYIVLGVLYESFIHPLTILSTLPSAGVGALLALMIFGYDLSVIALIGIVLLMGIVKKNAILMIDFAIEAERHQGMSPEESIVQAALLRFRPIMMTTLAALFGALPLALESGTGSELRNPLGVTIIGGLLLSQLLTLYTTPVVYLYMERLRLRLTGRGAVRALPAE